MKEQKTLFYHGKTTDNHRFTIAGRFLPLPVETITLGVSLCSSKDQFVKKIGRRKAEGRMNSKATLKGKIYYNLYESAMPENYFEGKEIATFINIVANFGMFNSNKFKAYFNL